MPQAKVAKAVAAKRTVKQPKKAGSPASSIAVAEALVKHWPEEATKIVKVMIESATSRSMRGKLNRVQRALERLGKDGQ